MSCKITDQARPIVAAFIQDLPSSPVSSFKMMSSLVKGIELSVNMIGFIEPKFAMWPLLGGGKM